LSLLRGVDLRCFIDRLKLKLHAVKAGGVSD
jgi:hypothetical protein